MSATARAATSRPASSRRPPASTPSARRRPTLTEVPPAPAAVAGNGVFALVVLGLLVAGMGVLLVLNTTLAQGAFEISALTSTQNKLAVSEQQLLQQVALAESPEALQKRADDLGMVPVASPVFLRLADGAVLGIPVPAAPGPKPARAALPSTGGLPAAPAAASATGTAAAAAKAKAPTGDAAVADPAPQTDAAVPDPTVTKATR